MDHFMSTTNRLLQGLVQRPGTRRRGSITIPGPDRLWPACLLMYRGVSIGWYTKGSQRAREPVHARVHQRNTTVRRNTIGIASCGYGVKKSHNLPSASWKMRTAGWVRLMNWGLLVLRGVQRPKNQRLWYLRAVRDGHPSLRRENSLFLGLFVPSGPQQDDACPRCLVY